jgi:hypothetical protein
VPPKTLTETDSIKSAVCKTHLVNKYYPLQAAHLGPGSPSLHVGPDGGHTHFFFLSPALFPIPCPLPGCLLLKLLATTHGTQGSHLAPMVVLRAKAISDCGVSIIDNKAPRTLITLLPLC